MRRLSMIALTWAVAATHMAEGGCKGALWAEERRSVSVKDIPNDEVKVKEIWFRYVTHKPFSTAKHRAAMTTRAGDRFQRRFFRNDMATLMNIYRDRGLMDVDIIGKSFELDADGELYIGIKIDSGEPWHIEEVEIASGRSGADAVDLTERLTVRVGEVFRYSRILADERELLGYLNKAGYPHASVRNELELKPKSRTARVAYRVDAGMRMYFGDVRIETGASDAGSLQTRSRLVRDNLTFRKGDLYNPEQLRRTRNRLARTNLFRSVTLSTPAVGVEGDSLQPVVIRLQERKFIHLEGQAFFNNTEPGLAANVQHSNWLGRGTRIGLDANVGRPLQGGTMYWTEPNMLKTGADLTLSAGLTDEWGKRQVFADPSDSLQFALLTANHSVLGDLLAAQELGLGDLITLAPTEFIASSVYDYRSIERLWQFTGSLTRRWQEAESGEAYQGVLGLTWTESRTRPVAAGVIRFNAPIDEPSADDPNAPDGGAGEGGGDSFGDDPFGEEDSFGEEDPFGEKTVAQIDDSDGADAFVDYADGEIPIDAVWRRILTDRARTLNLNLALQRDSRDNPIAPRRGTFVRLGGLYALQIGGQSTRVLDGEFEARAYLPFGDHLVWANASRVVLTASMRQDRVLPQSYWKELGGEGSVRGVARNSIQAIGGGRAGLNLRSELRLRAAAVGLVFFWDRAGVWRHANKAKWSSMTDGYGVGLRYDMGIPFRLDLGWSEETSTTRLDQAKIYFSIGQAF